MEYYDATHHESIEILACDLCFEPEWFVVFTNHPELKSHYCASVSEWRYGYYGSDVTYEDPAEALQLLTIHERVLEKYKEDTLLTGIDEVLGE